MNYWVNKLTSRKLWVAVAGFVSGLIVAFKGDADTAEVVGGLILQGASIIGYLLAEGLVDAKGAAVENVNVFNGEYIPPDGEDEE